MLLHLVPRIFACRVNEPECALIDFHCSELGLTLRNGIELAARRPYPNKNYLVACRNIGQKAMCGFLVETTKRVREFTTTTRWAIGDELIVNHQVQYSVLDDELDAPKAWCFGMLCHLASVALPGAGRQQPIAGRLTLHSRAWNWLVATVLVNQGLFMTRNKPIIFQSLFSQQAV